MPEKTKGPDCAVRYDMAPANCFRLHPTRQNRPVVRDGERSSREGSGAQPRPVSTTGGLPRSMITVAGPLTTIFPPGLGPAGVDARAVKESRNTRPSRSTL